MTTTTCWFLFGLVLSAVGAYAAREAGELAASNGESLKAGVWTCLMYAYMLACGGNLLAAFTVDDGDNDKA